MTNDVFQADVFNNNFIFKVTICAIKYLLFGAIFRRILFNSH